jgi:hypothetical protein
VFVAAEGLLRGLLVASVTRELEFEGAKLLVDDLPDYFVGCHGGRGVERRDGGGIAV